ncbi:MAG: polyribonucleotide nucleotidyltransferase [Candidatus Omnitrophota bacterium]
MGLFVSSDIDRNVLTFSTGDWARQANASVKVCLNDTVVFVSACISKDPKETLGFLPLTVEYREKTYAMGKIPGGFIKREGRPKDNETLSARLIDRPLRPLFPKGLTNEIQIISMVLSSDGEHDPDVLALNAASCALFISDIPFDKPVGAVRVSKIEGSFVVNPTYQERSNSGLDLVVVGSEDKILMLEGGLDQISEQEVIDAIEFAHPHIRKIISLQKDLREKAGKPKKECPLFEFDSAIFEEVKKKAAPILNKIYGLVGKEERQEKVDEFCSELYEQNFSENEEITLDKIKNMFDKLEEDFVRLRIIKEEKRPDNRGLADIRPIDCQVRVLERTHGSAIFTRGQTQSLTITTLGTSSDGQTVEAFDGRKSKNFMLHYNFPPFSVGEVKPIRGVSRRETGHGALAEKSLVSVIPSKEEFPYTIRAVSEILESNGSSSMATVCATSLSLMDAGVPLKEPVAGIAMGLVSDGSNYKILTDIAGIEDHCGDMDFKIAGTKNGITAIQLDTKIEGLSYEIISKSLEQARIARLSILESMNKSISIPRESVSEFAPKIKAFQIPRDKIGSVIGPGGQTIRAISRENNVTIDIDDEFSMVSVVAKKHDDLERAVQYIQGLVKDVEVGEIYDAVVERIANFGAFCELLPGKTGLLHVSEIADTYVKDVREFLKEGDTVRVKVLNVDVQGKISLSMKQAK